MYADDMTSHRKVSLCVGSVCLSVCLTDVINEGRLASDPLRDSGVLSSPDAPENFLTT